MKKLCQLLNKTEDELFNEITSSFKDKITQWDYFVNWKKVLQNIEPIEKELNLLNYLIGKKNLRKETIDLLLKYPETIKAIPLLLVSWDTFHAAKIVDDMDRLLTKHETDKIKIIQQLIKDHIKPSRIF